MASAMIFGLLRESRAQTTPHISQTLHACAHRDRERNRHQWWPGAADSMGAYALRTGLGGAC